MSGSAPEDLPLVDLQAVVSIGLGRGGPLLTAGEAHTAGILLALAGPPGRLYARLSTRKPRCFRESDLEIAGVPDLAGAVAALEALGLVGRQVPAAWRARAASSAELGHACAQRGLKRSGSKAERIARLAAHGHRCPGRWFRLRHLGLVRRLERWAFLRPAPDRSTLVVERLGVVRWPRYALTRGVGLHRDRRALRRWEALLRADLDADTAIAALRAGCHRAPGRLDLGRALRAAVAAHAHALERGGSPEQAAGLYASLVEVGERAEAVAFRHARALEAAGSPHDALQVLTRARTAARAAERRRINRAGRRLAKQLRTGWAPDPPLRKPRTRTLYLPPGPAAARPRWTVGSRALPVEAAVCSVLADGHRRALHVEGAVWSTLFALLFADTYFLDVPGALPVRFLSGPLDLGSPAFRSRRADAVATVLDAVADGHAPALLRRADATWRGTRLAWARWGAADGATLACIAEGLGPGPLRTLLECLLDRGRRALRGLPDLVVLPGPPIELPGAWPRRLPGGLLLAEVKGPTDAVRDGQAVWFDRLVRAGAPVELWEVRAAPGHTALGRTEARSR